jgi:hypothetical protein
VHKSGARPPPNSPFRTAADRLLKRHANIPLIRYSSPRRLPAYHIQQRFGQTKIDGFVLRPRFETFDLAA